jgi:ABC-type glycerol-3-phosphate transport system substrate-binding protein
VYQHGAEYYKNDGAESALDSPEAYAAFREWTEFYTNYGIPTETDFFTRFRSGDSPIGIGGFSHYQQLSTSAPELYGRWSIAPIPGIVKEDGTIDRSVGSITGETVMIMQQSQKKEAAWKFLEWWTSEDVQVRYGRELEALLGVEARWNTANKDAFNSLSWKPEHLEVIQYQQAQAREVPVVLGGYFTGRHISNAWNRIVLEGMTVRDSLEQAVIDINKELLAKQEEYKYKPGE